MYLLIEKLEKEYEELKARHDVLARLLDEEKKFRAYDTKRHWDAICDLRFEIQQLRGETNAEASE